MTEMKITYTYPDGVTIGGTYTDVDIITSEADFQAIIDKVIANTRAEQNKRIIKMFNNRADELKTLLDATDNPEVSRSVLEELQSVEYWIDRIKGENK